MPVSLFCQGAAKRGPDIKNSGVMTLISVYLYRLFD